MKIRNLAAAIVMGISMATQVMAAVNLLPAIQGPNGPVMADPVVNIGKDSVTNLPCVVGFTATCVLSDAGGGGGTNASVKANGTSAATSSTLFGVSDGANQQQMIAPIGLGDGVNGNNMVSAGGWVFNGTTWDRMRGDATNGLKVNCSICGGSTATASATPTPTAAGTGKSFNISTDNSGLFMIPVKPGTTTQIDLSSASLLAGADGVNAMSPSNPLNTKPVAQAPTVLLGSSAIADAAGTILATVKAGSTAPAITDPALVVIPSVTPTLPCNAKVAVSVTASTDLVTFTNTGYICSIILVGAAAENWGLVDGTGTVCATGTAGVIGGTTGTAAMGANNGFTAINDRPWLFTSGTAKHLCLIKSGSGNISGVITYRDAL